MPRRHPDWLKVNIPGGKNFTRVNSCLRKYGLHTVCAQARCPNMAECYGNGTATFLLLGNVCTRGCRYCNISPGNPAALDPYEPDHIAAAVAELGLEYAVITSVTRDDLADGGALQFARSVRAIRAKSPRTGIEILVPDFNGSLSALQTVTDACPNVLAHNIEVVKQLFARLRPKGSYTRSLQLLRRITQLNPGITVKSGLMLGLGETTQQIKLTLKDLRNHGVAAVSLGQYLQPAKTNAPVHRYYSPEEFTRLKAYALSLGFLHVEASPLTRSSYHAERIPCG